eukprot:COSAG02_NODE_10077_length_2031_cov_2.207981_1_plen_267_part_10
MIFSVDFSAGSWVPAGVSASWILTEKFVLSVEHESPREQDSSATGKLDSFRNTAEAQGSAVSLQRPPNEFCFRRLELDWVDQRNRNASQRTCRNSYTDVSGYYKYNIRIVPVLDRYCAAPLLVSLGEFDRGHRNANTRAAGDYARAAAACAGRLQLAPRRNVMRVLTLVVINLAIIVNAQDTSCAGSWSACTAACETADDRTWTEVTAQHGSGAACPVAVDCEAGEDGCETVVSEWDSGLITNVDGHAFTLYLLDYQEAGIFAADDD